MALTPAPASLFALEEGAPREEIMGRRYESVFPVPVGEMAARSRDLNQCEHSKPTEKIL
jgi:hypothetical protein